MSIQLRIERCPVISLDDETITLGSDPSCAVPLPPSDGLFPKHAVIRKIAGRWIVEVRGGDSIRVGDDEHTRLHWLNPGDVIRLTDDCATITFEPSGAEPEAPRPSAVVSRPTLRSSSTTPAKPTPSEPEVPRLSKPKSAVVSSFAAAEEQGEIRSLPPASKPSKSSRPARKPEPEFAEAPANPPVLKRLNVSSWSDNSQFASTVAAQHRARRRFWIQTGGVGVLVAVVLGIWIAAGSRPRTPSQTDVVPTRDPSIDAPAQPDVPTVASRSPTEPKKPAEESKPSTQKVTDEPKGSTKSRVVTASSDMPTGSSSKTPVGDGSAVTAPPIASGGTPSVVMQATRDGVFAVFAQHSVPERCFRIGTAWVASRRQLVTSGAVALAVEELQRQGLKIVVSQPGLERPIAVTRIRVHPAYRSAAEKVAIARQQLGASDSERTKSGGGASNSAASPDSDLARAFADQTRFDLGVLDVATGERLKNPLNLDAGDLPDVTSAQFVLIGLPFQGEDYHTKSPAISDEPQERISSPGSSVQSESSLALSMEFPNDVADGNWSGSPVLNRGRRVIGVYSRATTAIKGDTSPRRHSVIWLGRLREFVPELE